MLGDWFWYRLLWLFFFLSYEFFLNYELCQDSYNS